jgi:hypothetical protein
MTRNSVGIALSIRSNAKRSIRNPGILLFG